MGGVITNDIFCKSVIYSKRRTDKSNQACLHGIGRNKKDYLLNLHQSVLQRCIDILERRGGETKYSGEKIV